MSNETQLEQQLNAEWRKTIKDNLEELRTGQKQLAKDITDIKLSCAQADEVKSLREKVEKLELSKAKTTGVLVAVNVILIFAGWCIQTLLLVHHS
jgi:hypothetical protein